MKKYFDTFIKEVEDGLTQLDWECCAKATKILMSVYEQNGTVYIIGNGGSSSIASHWANDLNKTTLGHKGDLNSVKRFQAICLTDNVPILTAWANDVGYEHVFSEQLRNFMQQTDAIIAISSSGNSPNIVKAAKLAQSQFVPVIALTGFGGGELSKIATVAVQVNSGKYTVVESVHGAIIHFITAYFYDWLRGSEDENVGF